MSEIDKKVLNVTLRELKQHFRNLKVKKIRSRRQGRPITDLEFTFQHQNLRELKFYRVKFPLTVPCRNHKSEKLKL